MDRYCGTGCEKEIRLNLGPVLRVLLNNTTFDFGMC